VLLAAPLLGMPIPLPALQSLWGNLVTDGLPGLALGVEPAEPNTMKRPPHPVGEGVFARGMGLAVLVIGLVLGGLSLGVGYWAFRQGNPAWTTMVFNTLTLAQMANALASRSDRESLFRLGLGTNKALLGAVFLTFLLQLAVTYVPFLQPIFETQALSPAELGITLAASLALFAFTEVWKALLRARTPAAA